MKDTSSLATQHPSRSIFSRCWQRDRMQASKAVPLYHSRRKKPRRWPLVLRFYKGAIHGAVLLPVVLHSLLTTLIVHINRKHSNVGFPSAIIPSLSLVVGLMLVFRNQSSYDRFWNGREMVTECCTCVRNLTRSFLVSSSKVYPATPARTTASKSPAQLAKDLEFPLSSHIQQADTEQVIKLLVASLFAIKHNLRGEHLATANGEPIHAASHPEFEALLPHSLNAVEHRGLSFPLQLLIMVEAYIRRCVHRSWVSGPQASQLSVQLNTLTAAYGKMEAIRTTPIPVAHLIHTKQVLALYGAVLPFSLVNEFGWWTVPLVAMLTFTLYGIDCIGKQLEDPFGYDRNDIKMDAIVEDARIECMVLLDLWTEKKVQGQGGGERMFD